MKRIGFVWKQRSISSRTLRESKSDNSGKRRQPTSLSIASRGDLPLTESYPPHQPDPPHGSKRMSPGAATCTGWHCGNGIEIDPGNARDRRRWKVLVAQTINSDEVRETALSLGGKLDDGAVTKIYDFTVPANQSAVRIQLELTCETWGGFFSAGAGCLYGQGKVASSLAWVDLLNGPGW